MKNSRSSGMQEMFRRPQAHLFEKSLEEQLRTRTNTPVECLGMTFSNDNARREYFLEKLQEKLKDPEFRKIEGFPIGTDEDILRLSDPPYYTACPNPFLQDFVRCYGKPYDPSEPYHRTPFAVDVSEGKTDALYKAHGYHTKVPPKAIIPAMLHYTEPGDLVLDGFAGSGMTGVAAQLCANPDSAFQAKVEAEWKVAGFAPPKWGVRRAVLSELSPAATFIAANYNLPLDIDELVRTAQAILSEAEANLGWMYETLHTDGKTKGRINYTIWSEVFSCPECSSQVVFLSEAMNKKTKRVREQFPCPHCSATLSKDNLERVFETLTDPATGRPWRRIKLKPVLINYSVSEARYEKEPDEDDLARLRKIEQLPLPPEVPTNPFPFEEMWEAPRLRGRGITHVHHLFLPRPVQALAALWRLAQTNPDARVRAMLLFMFEQGARGMSILNRYKPIQYGRIGGSQVGLDMPGTYYVPSISTEVSPWYQFDGKLARLAATFGTYSATEDYGCTATTSSTASLGLPENCVDYIFTDPPFGDNYPYAELNMLVESWHRVLTDPRPEAIVDRVKENHATQKGIAEYQRLMERCFREFYRVLKPGRWMTLVFSNSKNAVWHAIQEALSAAGFVIADVRTLDKQQKSFKQVTSAAPQQDLVISAYKPNGGLEARFQHDAGSESSVWDFVRAHLAQLPVFVPKNGRVEVIAERQAYVLFDRMVAFHVLRGVPVPISASEFYAGLAKHFPERDGMFFLPEEVAEYDKKRMTVTDVLQLELFVSDESSAIQWLHRELGRKPEKLGDLTPRFIQETQRAWADHEKPLELSELLNQNFICYDGEGEVPSQIHTYLSTNFKDLRNLSKNDAALRAKAEGRWYVPDPSKVGDLEKLREKALLREFETYRASTQHKLKVFRTEAVRAGFRAAYDRRDYKTIVEVATKLPDTVLHDDEKLLMYYDVATTRLGD